MLQGWFIEHPRKLNESYFQHQRTAIRLAAALFRAGTLCLIHALVPALFEHAASQSVTALHQKMSSRAREPA
jgi:hypothetical protein